MFFWLWKREIVLANVNHEISQLKSKVTRLNKNLANNQKQWVETFKYIQEQEHRQLPEVQTGKTEIIQ